MSLQTFSQRGLFLARAWIRTSALQSIQAARTLPAVSHSREFTQRPILFASAVPNPLAGSQATHPKDAPPPSIPESENPDQHSARHAAFLGEADSNDAHDANQDAFAPPAPSLDAKHSAYLGEADSDDGFEAHKDVEGRDGPPVDAAHSAYLGEADSDDGFEGRRAAHPEEGEHNIEDASVSGIHGQAGEGDGEIEYTRK